MSGKSKPESTEGTEIKRPLPGLSSIDQLTKAIIGAAIEVHRELGPGLLESAYEECLCYELSQLGLSFRRQLELPVKYKGLKLDCGYKMDLVVEDAVILELKCVDQLLPIHEAQLLTYLKLSGKEVGLLLNFRQSMLKNGIKRLVTRDVAGSASNHTSAISAIDARARRGGASPERPPKTSVSLCLRGE
jgi:GxxExxY protein